MKQIRTSFTLSPETDSDLTHLATDMRLSRTAAVELAVRVLKRIWETPIAELQIPPLSEQETGEEAR